MSPGPAWRATWALLDIVVGYTRLTGYQPDLRLVRLAPAQWSGRAQHQERDRQQNPQHLLLGAASAGVPDASTVPILDEPPPVQCTDFPVRSQKI